MKLLLFYPRRWRERYGAELVALLEAEPLTWRARANVAAAGLHERLRGSGSPQVTVLWAWSLFVIGGLAFQKTAEHWQAVVPRGGRAVPAAAFDVVQAAAVVGGVAVLAAVVWALPAFVRDLRGGGWTALRRPILIAAATTTVAVAALIALVVGGGVGSAAVFTGFTVVSLLAWTHAAAAAARRLPALRAHTYPALIASTTMGVMTVAAAVWFASVTAHSASFVGTGHLAVIATFMLAGNLLSAAGVRELRA